MIVAQTLLLVNDRSNGLAFISSLYVSEASSDHKRPPAYADMKHRGGNVIGYNYFFYPLSKPTPPPSTHTQACGYKCYRVKLFPLYLPTHVHAHLYSHT